MQVNIQKIQGHLDKTINSSSYKAKSKFLYDQIRFMTEFKEQAQVLNLLAKPSLNLQYQIPKLSKKMEKTFVNNLNREIIYTRRQISLQKVNDDSIFQTKIAQNYQANIEQLNRKLQYIQNIVQEGQQKKKNKEGMLPNCSIQFKSYQVQKSAGQSISQKDRIKNLLKSRLLMSGKIEKLLKQKMNYQLIKSKSNNHSYPFYNFLSNHSRLYRSPSSDQAIFKQQIATSTAKIRPKLTLSLKKFYLEAFERQIFIQQLQKLKNKNSRLQMQIQLLKKAESEKQDEKILKQLSNRKDLNMEESITREIFAFQKVSSKFQEKLQKCSYFWAQFELKPRDNRSFSNQQCFQKKRLQQNRRRFQIKRMNSSEGGSLQREPLNLQIKSYEKTNNSSLQSKLN